MIPGIEAPMGRKWLRDTEGEEGVLISLALSVGLVIFAAAGWWTWKILTRIAETVSILPPSDMP